MTPWHVGPQLQAVVSLVCWRGVAAWTTPIPARGPDTRHPTALSIGYRPLGSCARLSGLSRSDYVLWPEAVEPVPRRAGQLSFYQRTYPPTLCGQQRQLHVRSCYTYDMNDNNDGRVAALRDQTRQDATGPDYDYSLTIEDTPNRYALAGHPRTTRTLQRYCLSGHLDCQKVATALGDKYYVAPYSVARHIAQVNEQAAFIQRTTGRDVAGHAATFVAAPQSHDHSRQEAPTNSDVSRPVATVGNEITKSREVSQADVARHDDLMSRFVERLEGENGFLRAQLTKKDEQIEDLSQRFKETQGLLGAVQRMLAPLLGQPDPFKAQRTGEGSVRDVDSGSNAANQV